MNSDYHIARIPRTAKAADGTRHIVTGSMPTIIAGLACGEPCSIARYGLHTNL